MGSAQVTAVDLTGRTMPAVAYPLVISEPDVTVVGGVFSRPDLDPELTPWSTWHDTTSIITRRERTTVVGSTFYEVGDAVSISRKGLSDASHWTIANVDATNVHDDFCENDTMRPGKIVGSLVDGCSVFLSCRYGSSGTPPDGSANTVTVADCLVRVRGFWSSYNPTKYGNDRPGTIFKWSTSDRYGIPPKLRVYGTTFAIDSPLPPIAGPYTPPAGTEAADVTLLFPAHEVAPKLVVDGWTACTDRLTVLAGEAARSEWDARRSAHRS